MQACGTAAAVNNIHARSYAATLTQLHYRVAQHARCCSSCMQPALFAAAHTCPGAAHALLGFGCSHAFRALGAIWGLLLLQHMANIPVMACFVHHSQGPPPPMCAMSVRCAHAGPAPVESRSRSGT